MKLVSSSACSILTVLAATLALPCAVSAQRLSMSTRGKSKGEVVPSEPDECIALFPRPTAAPTLAPTRLSSSKSSMMMGRGGGGVSKSGKSSTMNGRGRTTESDSLRNLRLQKVKSKGNSKSIPTNAPTSFCPAFTLLYENFPGACITDGQCIQSHAFPTTPAMEYQNFQVCIWATEGDLTLSSEVFELEELVSTVTPRRLQDVVTIPGWRFSGTLSTLNMYPTGALPYFPMEQILPVFTGDTIRYFNTPSGAQGTAVGTGFRICSSAGAGSFTLGPISNPVLVQNLCSINADGSCILSHPNAGSTPAPESVVQNFPLSCEFNVIKDGLVGAEVWDLRNNVGTFITSNQDGFFTGTTGPMNLNVPFGNVITFTTSEVNTDFDGFRICAV